MKAGLLWLYLLLLLLLYAPAVVAFAAGECFYSVFMLPTSQSNPEQIKKQRIRNLVVFVLILVVLIVVLIAGSRVS